MVSHDQLACFRITNLDPHFATHESRTGVIPHAVSIDRAVDERIESSVGDHTEIDGRRPERSVLPPARVDRQRP